MANEYSKKTNAELVEILKARSLPHAGKKADMVARIQEDDKAKAAPAADAGDDVIDWDDDTTTLEPAATTATGEKESVANSTAIPNQQVEIDPSTTQELNAAEVGDKNGEATTEAAESNAAAPAQEEAVEGTNGTENGGEAAEPAKPAVDYTAGLSTTDLDAELAKRKARAEKFGIVAEPSTDESQKSIERAKRFGLKTADEASSSGVRGLDQALSSERPRKRGRGDDGDGHGRDGKRRNFSGRGRGRQGQGNHGRRRGPHNRNTNGNGNANGNANGNSRPQYSEQDRAMMDKRKERFASK